MSDSLLPSLNLESLPQSKQEILNLKNSESFEKGKAGTKNKGDPPHRIALNNLGGTKCTDVKLDILSYRFVQIIL